MDDVRAVLAVDRCATVRRLDDGRYGACERFCAPIAPERLAARPVARTCIGCAG